MPQPKHTAPLELPEWKRLSQLGTFWSLFKKYFLWMLISWSNFFRQNEVTNTPSSYLAVMLNETGSVYWPSDSSWGGPFWLGCRDLWAEQHSASLPFPGHSFSISTNLSTSGHLSTNSSKRRMSKIHGTMQTWHLQPTQSRENVYMEGSFDISFQFPLIIYRFRYDRYLIPWAMY